MELLWLKMNYYMTDRALTTKNSTVSVYYSWLGYSFSVQKNYKCPITSVYIEDTSRHIEVYQFCSPPVYIQIYMTGKCSIDSDTGI